MKLFGNRRRAAHAAPRQKLPRGTRAAIIAVCVVLALTGGVFAAWKLLVKPVQRPSLSQPDPEPVSEPDEAEPSVIHVTPHETEQPEEEPEPDVPTEQPKALQDGVYNILICGTDDDGTRTDTIIIAHLDANDHTVALLSIPRDTPVATGGGGLMKINSVYAGGGKDGMERLAARLKDLLGFPVDGYVLVDLEAFQKTVDLVRGVEFDVPMDMNYEDPSQNLYIHLQKGLQTLDGEQAMGLVRFRKGYATQDIQRTQTQQQFLKALEKNFTVEPKGKEIYHPSKLHNFSLYLDGQWYSLTAKPGTYDDNDPIGVLDVTVLSNLVLDQLLDIKDLRTSKRIDFVGGIRGLEELKKRVDSGEMKAAFALYPVSMQQLIDIADTGNIMPPKTTWFEPKLRSGVVIHTFEEK